MKLISFILLSTFFATLVSADQEYPFIQPLSVEHSNIKKTSKIVEKKIAVQEPKKIVVVVKETPKQVPLDTDLDGVIDSQDLCANTSKNFQVDKDGCPQAMTLNINFQYKKSTIPTSAKEQIKEFATFLNKNKHYHVIIYGYTDNVGNFQSNKKLSQSRADAVKKELIKNRISSVRLTAIGKSQENPIADNNTEEGRAKNRRIEIELLK